MNLYYLAANALYFGLYSSLKVCLFHGESS